VSGDVVDCVVVGAGVIGLSVARALALRGHETLLLEEAAGIGTGVSSRSSEVLHSGIYYQPDSLKARLCVRGRQLLGAYCREHGVAHRVCGKLIVATAEQQLATLERLRGNALRNGVGDVCMLTAAEARTLEPQLRCSAALHAPSTGIIDTHGLMQALLGDLQRAGGTVALRTRVSGGRSLAGGFELRVAGAADYRLRARRLVNAAGLGAQALAAALAGLSAQRVPPLYFAKGHYFALRGPAPFARLIYPLPEAGGLGIHLTLDLAGRARFGPDVQWLEKPDYGVDPALAAPFAAAVRRYWPEVRAEALQPDYAGVRPKLVPAGAPAADFLIQGAAQHGVAGLVNLYGIESPGLTAALAIAEYVSETL
jgi:L-2-hydroxyglutarate oxidase LhgO